MSYVKQEWNNGDVITAEKLNHIEDGIETSLPEACQFNADHTVKLGQQSQLAPRIVRWLENHWGGENIETTYNYFDDLWDAENDRPKYPRGTAVVSDFLEIEGEDPLTPLYIPFTAMVEPIDNIQIDIIFNIYGYRLSASCGVEIDTETQSKHLYLGKFLTYRTTT